MDLRQQFSVMRSWLWLFVAGVLLAAGTAFLVSSALPKVYEGTATLIVGQSIQSANPDYNQLLASQRLSQTYAEIATTTPLLERVIAANALSITPDALRDLVVADAPRRFDARATHRQGRRPYSRPRCWRTPSRQR